MKNNVNLTVEKNHIWNRFFNFIKRKVFKYKIENTDKSIEKDDKKDEKKIYYVEYDTDPNNKNYGDIVLENKIIRNSPYVKEIVNPIKYSEKSYTKEEKKEILKKYDDYKKGRIDINDLNLDEVIIINKLAKEEIKIRKNKNKS